METTLAIVAILAIQNVPESIAMHTKALHPIIFLNFGKMASAAENARFMEEMQKYDCIYNKFSKDFKDLHIKMNCWKKIAEKFKISITEAQNKFKNIRTAYGRFLKKKNAPSGSGRDALPTVRSLRSYGNRLIARIARIARIAAIAAIVAIIWKPGLNVS